VLALEAQEKELKAKFPERKFHMILHDLGVNAEYETY